MTLGERIKKLRKENDFTQQIFAEKIGTTANVLTNYETGRRNPSNSVINNICKTFEVSETWLRTGQGEMFVQRDREDEISSMVQKLLSGESSDFKRRLISVLAGLKEEQWAILEEKMREIIGSRSAPAPEPVETEDERIEREIDQEVERYRQRLIQEKNQAAQASTMREYDAG